LALGELTEVKNIRHECDFMMRDFRKRIASMFFPAFEAGIGHFLLKQKSTISKIKTIYKIRDHKKIRNFFSNYVPDGCTFSWLSFSI